MTQSPKQFTRVLHIVLVLAVLFIAAEAYQLRATVEHSRLTSLSGTDASERASLEQPLRDLILRLETLNATLDRPAAIRPASPMAGSEQDRESGRVPDPAPATESRTRMARNPRGSDLDERLEAILSTLEQIDRSYYVRVASLPPEDDTTPPIRSAAVTSTIASIRDSAKKRSELLMLDRASLLRLYGKPSRISFGAGNRRGQVRWWYEVSGDTSWLAIDLYDGRVIEIGGN